MALVNIKIEGIPYRVEAGLTILEAAKKCGYEIPSLCAFNHGECSQGSCRVCLVEVKGARGLVASCVYPVNEGMEIIISTLTHFRDEYLAHIVDKTCPAKVCKNLIHYTVILDKCVSCGRCAKACPVGAIYKTDYIAPTNKFASWQIDDSKCIKCGSCLATCKLKAIIKE